MGITRGKARKITQSISDWDSKCRHSWMTARTESGAPMTMSTML